MPRKKVTETYYNVVLTVQEDHAKEACVRELAEETIVKVSERGGTWMAYQNMALDSSTAGHIQLLAFGESCTFKEPPEKFPGNAVNCWAYLPIGVFIPRRQPNLLRKRVLEFVDEAYEEVVQKSLRNETLRKIDGAAKDLLNWIDRFGARKLNYMDGDILQDEIDSLDDKVDLDKFEAMPFVKKLIRKLKSIRGGLQFECDA